MRHNPQRTYGIRASDLEREEYAHRIEAANGEGRLTLAEADRRLALVYDATYRHELEWLVSDLPDEPAVSEQEEDTARDSPEWSGEAKARLGTHIAVVTVLSVLLVLRWSASEAPFFWPIFPLFWLATSVFVHVRIRKAGAVPVWPHLRRAHHTTGR